MTELEKLRADMSKTQKARQAAKIAYDEACEAAVDAYQAFGEYCIREKDMGDKQ